MNERMKKKYVDKRKEEEKQIEKKVGSRRKEKQT